MKKLLIILLLMLLSGCVSATYNVKTGEVKYLRLGNQKFADIEIVLDNGSGFTIKGQESDNAELVGAAIRAALMATP